MYSIDKSIGHVNNKQPFVPYIKDSSGRLVKASDNEVRLPDIQCWKGINRLQPLTAINTSTILTNSEIDFQIGAGLSRGILEHLNIEITLKNNDAVNNAYFNIYNIFQRIEIVDPKGSIFRTYYPDELFYVMLLYRSLEENNILRRNEGIDDNYVPLYPTIHSSSQQTFILQFNLFKNKMVDLRALNNTLMLRFYMNAPADINMAYPGFTTTTNISIVSFFLLSKEVDYPLVRYSQPIYQRYINYTRFVQSLQLVPSQSVDIQLNTFSGYSPFIFFMLRNSPTATNGDNWSNMLPLDNLTKYEFRDSSNNIVGVNMDLNESRYFINSVFLSDFLSKINTYLIVIPFALAPQKIEDNMVTGGYQFTTREILHLEFGASLNAGTYELTVWQASYECFGITPSGDMLYTK